ncbi:nucleoside phosphorylase domain-containing protein [Aspergillus germanicus]
MATENTPTTPSPPPTDIMIGWICVLQAEYRAAIRILDKRYDSTGLVRGQGDENHYVLGRVGAHNIAINLPPAATYGQLHATRIALDMRSTFPRVRFVLLVGIAGGAPSAKHDIRLGDLVLGTSVVPYATGKETGKGFERHAMVRAPPTELLDAITLLDERLWAQDVVLAESIECVRRKDEERGQEDFQQPESFRDRFYHPGYLHQETGCDCQQEDSGLQHIDNLCPHRDRKAGTPVVQLFQGAIGSDNIVMKNADKRDEIARRENILYFEMEATGVMDVVPCLPIRGISDYADGRKNDGWHLYAALAAQPLSLTLPGTLVDRYISGAISNPNAFSESEIERMKSERSRHGAGDVRNEMQRLKKLQQHLMLHMQDLDRSLNQCDHLLLSGTDPSEREQYERLRTQVQKDEEAMDSLAELVGTTSTLLMAVGRIRNDQNLTITGTVLAAGRDFVGSFMRRWWPSAAVSPGLDEEPQGRVPDSGARARPSDTAEQDAVLIHLEGIHRLSVRFS